MHEEGTGGEPRSSTSHRALIVKEAMPKSSEERISKARGMWESSGGEGSEETTVFFLPLSSYLPNETQVDKRQ